MNFRVSKDLITHVNDVLTVHEMFSLILDDCSITWVSGDSWQQILQLFLLFYELSFIDCELLNFGLISFNSIANLYFVTFGDAQFAKFNQKLVEEKEMNELLW